MDSKPNIKKPKTKGPTKRQKEQVWDTFFPGQLVGNCCFCGRELRHGEHEIEHIIPKSSDGSNDPENLQIACGICNREKSNTNNEEYVMRINKYKILTENTQLLKKTKDQEKQIIDLENINKPVIEAYGHSITSSQLTKGIVVASLISAPLIFKFTNGDNTDNKNNTTRGLSTPAKFTIGILSLGLIAIMIIS